MEGKTAIQSFVRLVRMQELSMEAAGTLTRLAEVYRDEATTSETNGDFDCYAHSAQQSASLDSIAEALRDAAKVIAAKITEGGLAS